MASTFYSDGYQDAINARGCLPPAPVKRSDGEVSNCHRNEYLEGFADGRKSHWVDVGTISEYGLTQRLSNSIRCF